MDKLDHKNKISLFAAWGLLWLCGLATLLFAVRALYAGYLSWALPMDMATTAQVGDFFGGFIGTLLSGASFIFLYLTLKSQLEAADHQKTTVEEEKIESRFFELLNVHRENVSELALSDGMNGKEIASGRKVFTEIYHQLLYALEIIEIGTRSLDITTILKKESFIASFPGGDQAKRQLINANLAYSIVFFGVSKEGEAGLCNALTMDFTASFVKLFIAYIRLIPVQRSKYWPEWKSLTKRLDFEDKVKSHLIDEPRRADTVMVYQLDDEIKASGLRNYYKFFGGHQSKLGHYYRHLYGTVDYLDSKLITFGAKMEYIRILRAQLSIYEQFLFLFNSLCYIGRDWELNHRSDNYKWYITKFDLIRNIPYTKVSFSKLNKNLLIDLKLFYPNVTFEFTKESDEKKEYKALIAKQDQRKIK